MANPTMTLIASNTVGSGGVSTVTFSSIPATYTDLKVVASARTDAAGTTIEFRLQINSDTAANYDWIRIYGDGTNTASQKGSTIGAPYTSFILAGGLDAAGNTANTFGNLEIYLPNYTSSNYKSTSSDAVLENNTTTAYALLTAGIWKSTSAVTSMTVYPASGNFVQYSTFYLYGIKNA